MVSLGRRSTCTILLRRPVSKERLRRRRRVTFKRSSCSQGTSFTSFSTVSISAYQREGERWLWWSDVRDCWKVSHLILLVMCLWLCLLTHLHSSSCGQTQPQTDSPAEMRSPLKAQFTAWNQFSNQAFNVNNCLHPQPYIHSQCQTTWGTIVQPSSMDRKCSINHSRVCYCIAFVKIRTIFARLPRQMFNLQDQKWAD